MVNFSPLFPFLTFPLAWSLSGLFEFAAAPPPVFGRLVYAKTTWGKRIIGNEGAGSDSSEPLLVAQA